VNLKTYQRKWRIDRGSIRRYLQRVWRLVGAVPKSGVPEETETTVVFLSDAQMQHYNRSYRNKDYPTDVLSFPVKERIDGRHYLGDILISLERVASQATEQGHSFEKELRVLLLHSVLHLLGHDHEADSGQMDRLETRLRRKLLLPLRRRPTQAHFAR